MTSKSMGNSYKSTGFRLYKEVHRNGKYAVQLISWSIRKCIDCGQFLSKKISFNRCHECGKKHKLKISKEWHKKMKR